MISSRESTSIQVSSVSLLCSVIDHDEFLSVCTTGKVVARLERRRVQAVLMMVHPYPSMTIEFYIRLR